LPTLDKLYAVAIRVSDEEDARAATHSVRLALEVHSAHPFQLFGEGVEVLDGEGDVTVALT